MCNFHFINYHTPPVVNSPLSRHLHVQHVLVHQYATVNFRASSYKKGNSAQTQRRTRWVHSLEYDHKRGNRTPLSLPAKVSYPSRLFMADGVGQTQYHEYFAVITACSIRFGKSSILLRATRTLQQCTVFRIFLPSEHPPHSSHWSSDAMLIPAP